MPRVVGGVAGFYLVHFAVTGFGRFPSGWAFPALSVPGILFLLSWFWRRRTGCSITWTPGVLGSASATLFGGNFEQAELRLAKAEKAG